MMRRFFLMAYFFSLVSWSTLSNFNPSHTLKDQRSMIEPLSFHTKRLNVDGQVITRSTPLIDGIAVEGADDIYADDDLASSFRQATFTWPKANFLLSVEHCMQNAIDFHKPSLIKDPFAQKIDDYYVALWLHHFDETRPVFKIRLPTLSIVDLKDIYVDAATGDILRVDDVAQFATAPANVFVYSPTTPVLDEKELQPVVLKNLVDIKDGGFLNGEYVSVRTCCRYYTCPNEGACPDSEKRCALKSHNNARQSRELLNLPTDTLGLDAHLSLPPSISVDTVRCTYLPFARAALKKNSTSSVGFFEKPVDEPGAPSEMDRFSEVQAYFSIMSFFNHIRTLLNDPTWCLREEAMSCNSDGSPVLDQSGQPKNPYRVFVNQLIPDMKLMGPHQNDQDNFMAQVHLGKGTENNPIVLNDFIRFSNAAFVPALSKLKKSTPRADEILSDLIKPFDHNVFFQGHKDFAYDGDVVFHEFMHAITTSLINKINTLGLDKWGIHSEPGSLNESWSDYFAAAFTNDPAVGQYANVQGGYGEVALRNIDNQASCPADIIGEIHNDGLIWSGALWEIRTRIKERFSSDAALQFDRTVLASLAQAKTTEDFKTQSEKLIKNIKLREGLGDDAAAIADEIFQKRGIRDCFRVATLSTVDKNNRLSTTKKDMLFIPSKNQILLKNYAPAALQLEIGIPAGTKSLTLTWRQYLGGTGALMGTETTPETAKHAVPLSIITNDITPIVWQFKHARANATDGNNDISGSLGHATFSNGAWRYTMPVDLEHCEQKTIYASLLSNDFKYVVQNLSIEFNVDDNEDHSDCDFAGTVRTEIDKVSLDGCSSHNPNGIFLFVLLTLYLWRRRFWEEILVAYRGGKKQTARGHGLNRSKNLPG